MGISCPQCGWYGGHDPMCPWWKPGPTPPAPGSGGEAEKHGSGVMTPAKEARYREPYTGVFDRAGQVTFDAEQMRVDLLSALDAAREERDRLREEVQLFGVAASACKPWIHSRSAGTRKDRGDLVAVHESQRDTLFAAVRRLLDAAAPASGAPDGE